MTPGYWSELPLVVSQIAVTGMTLRPLGLAETAGLTLLCLGAIATHAKAKDPAKDTVPASAALLPSAGVLVLQVIVD